MFHRNNGSAAARLNVVCGYSKNYFSLESLETPLHLDILADYKNSVKEKYGKELTMNVK
jgi:hypothetical protein